MALAQYQSPHELTRLRKKAEGKLILLGYGPCSDPVGIFTTIDGAIWSMRHYGPYKESRFWWVMLFEKDLIDKEGCRKLSVHDSIVRYVFEKVLV